MPLLMPMPSARDAPRFSRSPADFDKFFESVRILAERCHLTDLETTAWAVRYAGSESELWGRIDRDNLTLDEFKKEVAKSYPNLADGARYTVRELHDLVRETSDKRSMTRDDYGAYYREFSVIADYLVTQHRLSEREKQILYLDGLPNSVHDPVLLRLELKCPDALSGDDYPFSAVHEAALHVLRSTRERAFRYDSSRRDLSPEPVLGSRSRRRSASRADRDERDSTSFVRRSNDRRRSRSPRSSRSGEDDASLRDLVKTLEATVRAYAVVAPLPQQAPVFVSPGGLPFNTAPQAPLQQAYQMQQQQQQPAPPQYQNQNQQHRQQYSQQNQGQRPPQFCRFCGVQGHYVRDCQEVPPYINDGKVIYSYGKLAFPDGRPLDNRMPGNTLRQKIDNAYSNSNQQSNSQQNNSQQNYNHSNNNNGNVAAVNYLESNDEYVFAVDIAPQSANLVRHPSQSLPLTSRMVPQASPEVEDLAEQNQILQARLDSLEAAQAFVNQKRPKEVFDGVHVPPKVGPPQKQQKQQPATVFARGPPPHTAEQSKSKDDSAPGPSGKPGARAGNDQSTRGPMKPVEYPPKPSAEDPKYHYRSLIESTVEMKTIVDRALDAPVTMTARELLAAAPEVRRQVKDLVASKRVAANMVEAAEVDDIDYDVASIFEAQAMPMPVDFSRYVSSSYAVPSLPLRVIYPTFAPGVEPECILDGGAQMVIIRRDVWERIGAPITADKAIKLEAANASTAFTLGMVENHPVRFGPVTVHLQMQVVEDAPFEVLLGRPFFDVVNGTETSVKGGKHTLQVHDPTDGKPYRFATDPRPSNLRQPPYGSQAAVNFRK